MARYVRNAAVLLKLESTYGTDPTPTGGANALLVSDLTYPEFVAQNVDRGNVKPYFGNDEQLVGTYHQTCGFSVELAGSGAAGTEPAWGALLQAMGFEEDVQASYVAYTPVTEGILSCTIYFYDSGVFHKFTGARGTARLVLKVGEKPRLVCTFTGLYNTLTAAAVPAVTLTPWVTPLIVNNANSGQLTLGATYSAGGISSGTEFCSQGLEIDLANEIAVTQMVGCVSADITDRKPVADLVLELDAAAEVSGMAAVLANTLSAVSMEHGTAAGNIVLVHMPKVQRINPRKEELNGLRLIGYQGIVKPDAGNDEIVIVAK